MARNQSESKKSFFSFGFTVGGHIRACPCRWSVMVSRFFVNVTPSELAARAQGQFSWEVPKDTADLSVEAGGQEVETGPNDTVGIHLCIYIGYTYIIYIYITVL